MMSFRSFIIFSSACRRLVNTQSYCLKMTKPLVEQTDNTLYRCSQVRFLAMKEIDSEEITESNVKKKERAKTPEAPKITLLDVNNSITICTLQEAEKIAKSKKFRLVRVVDPQLRTQRPTFKLMSEADYLDEELREKRKAKEEKMKKKASLIRGEKLITISVRSTDHDIETKINKSIKWLKKCYEVRVIILGSVENTTPQEEIYKKFESSFKDIARILQKRIKNGALKFQLIPPKKETEGDNETDEENQTGNTKENKEEMKTTNKKVETVSNEICEAVEKVVKL